MTQQAMLAIFHLKELIPPGREVLLRAASQAEALDLGASALDISAADLHDARRFAIAEMNYGDDFRAAGPRGVIVVF